MLPNKYIIHSSDGFAISSKAWRDFVKENDLHEKITHLLGTIIVDDKKSAGRASKHVQKLINNGLLSEVLVGEIFRAYSLLSSIMHDAKVALEVGNVQEQIIHGEATLLTSLKDIWSLYFSTESLLRNRQQANNFLEKGIAVTVKKVSKTQKAQPASMVTHHSSLVTNSPTQTATKIYVNITKPTLAERLAKRHVDGALAFDSEEKFSETITSFAKSFSPRPVVCRATLDSIKQLRNESRLKNLWMLLPFVQTVGELREIKKTMIEAGLYRSPSFRVWMAIDTPSQVVLLEKFIDTGIDGISIDLSKLTMCMLGINYDNLEDEETNDAVLWAIERVIKIAHKYHITSSILGDITPKLLEHLIRFGITSICVNPEDIDSTRQQIGEIERRLLE